MVETNKDTQMRGQLTQRVKEKSVELLGYEISIQELRLLPHLTYIMVNSQVVDPRTFSKDEVAIMTKWVAAGLLIRIGPAMRPTAGFWMICSELLWLGYVDLKA